MILIAILLRWFTKLENPACKCFWTKGASQSETSMLAWLKEIFLPYCVSKNRGPDEWAMLIMDPAQAHRTKAVKAFCEANRIVIGMMPASTTYKFQMIDVVVGKAFKNGLCNKWADWMMEKCESAGLTKTGNFRHPTWPDCLKWVAAVWEDLDTAGVVRKAAELKMTSDPGPVVEGYVDTDFKNVQPRGEVEEVRDRELEQDLEEKP